MSTPTARAAAVFHCPFCADEDLRPVPDPAGGWRCASCARVFTVDLVRIAEDGIPGRVTATPAPHASHREPPSAPTGHPQGEDT